MTNSWSPENCHHVVGTYEDRAYDEDGLPEIQDVHVVCRVCAAEWKTGCTSGNPNRLIARFAARHLHRDPFASPRIVEAGTLRRKKPEESL